MTRKGFRVTLVSASVALAVVAGAFVNCWDAAQPKASAAAPRAEEQAAAAAAVSPLAAQTLERLRGASGQQVATHASRRTGVYDSVRVVGGPTSVLAAANALLTPEARARGFLAEFGGLVGMTAAERQLAADAAAPPATTDASALVLARVKTEANGAAHVKFDQTYRGMPVLGGQLVVHLNRLGVTGVNGNYVPDVRVGKTPKVTAAKANATALASLRKSPAAAALRVFKTALGVYREGLLEGYKGRNRLAHAVTVLNANGDSVQVWVDAQTGDVLNRIELTPHALYRLVFAQTYSGNDADAVIDEGNPLKPAGPLPPSGAAIPPGYEAHALYHFAGHTYNFFSSGVGWDSFDNKGSRMRTLLLASTDPNIPCPNAWWNGTNTNYCPEVTSDDVVSHEWGHAYTQFTHNLIYSYQSGALNESYSDIYGESVDLLNNHDAEGGTDNSQPTEYTVSNGQYVPTGGGVRWRVGEDVQGLNVPSAGILRDMWNPEAFANPAKTSSDNYFCGSGDGGGVHTNSGVPNHAYALLVDGGTFNNVTVQGIGLTRALSIYFRAADVYQVSSTNFEQHAEAVVASCNDLIGQPLSNFSTSSPLPVVSAELVTAATCQQVENALAAVEMTRDVTEQCGFQSLLDPNTPAACDGATDVFSEDWETGMDGWTVGNQGSGDAWPGTNWTLRSPLPDDPDGTTHPGTAAFAVNPQIGEPNGGTCSAGGDVSGHFWLDSPEITVPAGAQDLKLAFEHFVQTEAEWDGGNVKVSVNGGAFQAVPKELFLFNPTNFTAPDGNPLAGEPIWNGANGGEQSGSWGVSVADLSTLTNPGDKIKIRFDFGQDGCNGNLGWLVDNVRLYACPFLEPPVLSLGADYGNPDKDGRYTLEWTQPAGSTGPSVVQESTACGPLFADDAGEPLVAGSNSKWVGSAQWTSQPNPGGGSLSYYIPDGAEQDESLTTKGAIALPALPPGGSISLTFTTRQGLENTYDYGRVEVSADGGANWTEAAAYTGPAGFGADPVTVFSGARSVDLTQFAGLTVKLRFRLTSDSYNEGAPAGWHIDDIAVTASAYRNVAADVAGHSYTFAGKGDGNFCYRVATGYDVAGGFALSGFSNVEDVTVSNVVCLTNVAAAANGGSAVGSSTYPNNNFAASGAIDGDRVGANWGNGGGWNDATRDAYDDWLEVSFAGAKRVRQVNVVTLQDAFKNPSQPGPGTTASLYGLLDFEVQYWDGAQWVTLPGGNITGNTLAVRTVSLAPLDEVTTTKIRVLVHNAREHFSRVVEVEAIGCDAQP